MRRVFGLGLVILGVFFFLLPELRGGEKAQAVLFMGHWFDIPWESGLPGAVIGAFLCPSASPRLRGKSRPGSWR